MDRTQARLEDLLPVIYFRVVFALPVQIADIAYQNKAKDYGQLFKASAQTLLAISAVPELCRRRHPSCGHLTNSHAASVLRR